MEDDIVVTALRLPVEGFLSFFSGAGKSVEGSYFFTDTPTLEGGGGGDPDPGTTLPTVTTEEFLYPASIEALLQRFRTQISFLANSLGSAVPPATFKGPDGKDIDYTGVWANFLYYDIRVTDPAKDNQYLKNYGGTLNVMDDGYLTRVKVNTLDGYDKFGIPGINYFIFHELAHTLKEVQDNYAVLYNQLKEGGGIDADFGKSPQFIENEKYTNYVAREIARSVGEPIMDNPPFKYPD